MGGGPSDEEKQKAAQAQAQAQQAIKDRSKELLGEAQAAREADMAKGRERGNELFGEGALGRVSAERSADIADVVARRKAALSGLTPEQQNALQSQALAGIQQGTQTNLRQLRGIQGAQGIRGGAAAAQQANVLNQGLVQRANAERDIFTDNINRQAQALNSLEGTLQQAEQNELARQQFNLDQGQREKFGQLSTEFGYAGLGSAERGGIAQQAIGEQEALSARTLAEANQGKK